MKYAKRSLCLLLAVLLLTLAGCNALGQREFQQDIVLQLDGREGELLIREWRYLLGSGADIYYCNAGNRVLLGETTGGDNGYCPFAEGKYSIEEDGDTITVKWLFRADIWKEKQFTLPD